MKVFIKNKLISLDGSSEVFDEENKMIYEVKGKLISPTKKKQMYDKDGNLLFTIRNKYWTMFYDRVFIFDAEKNKIATIKKGKWSFNRKYVIEDCVDSMEIQGKFFKRTSQILRNGQVVGSITNEFSLAKDSFSLEADEKDIPFLTALVIAYDNIIDKINNLGYEIVSLDELIYNDNYEINYEGRQIQK